MGVTQVPMASCLNTELYYTAISHHAIPGNAKGLFEIQGFLSVSALWSTYIERESAAPIWLEVLKKIWYNSCHTLKNI